MQSTIKKNALAIKYKILLKPSTQHYYLCSIILYSTLIYLILPDIYTSGTETLALYTVKLLLLIQFVCISCFLWVVISIVTHKIPTLKKQQTLMYCSSQCVAAFYIASSLFHYLLYQEHWTAFSLSNAYTGMLAGEAPLNLAWSQIVIILAGVFITSALTVNFIKFLFPARFNTPFNLKYHVLTYSMIFLISIGAQTWGPATPATKIVNQFATTFPLIKSNPLYNNQKLALIDLKPKKNLRIRNLQQLENFNAQKFIENKTITTPDILFVHIESFRSDFLTPEITPNLYAFAQDNIHLKNHYSSSNNTPSSIFGLLNGLSADYFQYFRDNPQPLATLSLFQALGYQFNLFHASNLSYQNIDSLFFYSFNKHKSQGIDYSTQDVTSISNYLEHSINNTQQARFDYLVIESTHFPYHYPNIDAFNKFKPSIDKNFKISSDKFNHLNHQKTHIKNRFKNSMYYADTILGRLLATLEKENRLKSTIVVITGDHGEEFWEKNRFGHSYSLVNEQIKVSAIMSFPDKENVRYHFSSHQDFMPTILSFMGVDNAHHVTNGKDLFEYNKKKDFSFSAMGVISSVKRYDYAAISEGLKVTYRFKDSIEITSITNDDDTPSYNWEKEQVKALILAAEDSISILNLD